jgi:hypothetical protein
MPGVYNRLKTITGKADSSRRATYASVLTQHLVKECDMRSLQNLKTSRSHSAAAYRLAIMIIVFTFVIPAGLSRYKSKHFEAQNRAADPNEECAITMRVTRNQVDDGGTPHTLAASYYRFSDAFKATVTLNNKGPEPLDVKPTLFSPSGEQLDVPAVEVESNSFRVFDISDWASAGGVNFNEGSIQLSYRGATLLLGGQVRMVDAKSSLIFDEQLVEPAAMFSLSHLEGVWRLAGRDSQVSLVLSNMTASAISAAVVVNDAALGQEGRMTVEVAPHGTRVIDASRALMSKAGRELSLVGGISVDHSGPKGGLLARGFISEEANGYSSAIQFIDPQNAKSSALHGAGLRLGMAGGELLSPVVVARNVGGASTAVTGRVRYTTNDGRAGIARIGKSQLRPGESRSLNLTDVISRGRHGDIITAGIELEYTGEAGSVVASALSMSQSGDQVFHVPMIDPAGQPSSTGGYPWYVEGGSSTIVYIKNVTDHAQHYSMHVTYDGGDYSPTGMSVEAGQTIAVDIRALRDQQSVDGFGRTMPAEANRGQVHWSVEGSEPRALIGRAEQADEGSAISSSYACAYACPDSWVEWYMTPDSGLSAVGGTFQFNVYRWAADCFGSQRLCVVGASWASLAPGVASVNSSGKATGLAGGTATIRASFQVYQYDCLAGCPSLNFTDFRDATYLVLQVSFQRSDGSSLPSPLRVGISATTLGGVAHDRTQHLRAVISPANEADSVAIVPSDFNRLQITRVSTSNGVIAFDVVGKAKSGERGDVEIRASYSGSVISRTAVTVVVPGQIATPHDTTGGGAVIENRALNQDTSPALTNVASDQFSLVTVYIRKLTITVKDQFGDAIGDIYQGAEISEREEGTVLVFKINQSLTASGTYTDPVGFMEPSGTIVPISDPRINAWPSQSKIPLRSGTNSVPQRYSVFVDGFRLNPDPAITNRQVTVSGDGHSTTSPPVSITINWP